MRKTKLVTIEAEGRDHGKTFLITEMSALAAEKWGSRAMLALVHSGLDIPEYDRAARVGMAGVATMGLKVLGRVGFAEAEPLLDEMMLCIRRVEDRRLPDGRPLVNNGGEGDDIEEVSTRLYLRAEVFELHTGFTVAAMISRSAAAAAAQRLPTTRTSRRRLAP
jgi:hypothetical protein